MIYTTYLAQMKKIPDEARKIIIMRYMPASLKDPKYNVEWEPNLAPEDILLTKYKKGDIDFLEFREKYIEQLDFNTCTANTVKKFIKEIKENPDQDIYFICCEKNNLECHRRFFINHLNVMLGPSMLDDRNFRDLIGGEKTQW